MLALFIRYALVVLPTFVGIFVGWYIYQQAQYLSIKTIVAAIASGLVTFVILVGVLILFCEHYEKTKKRKYNNPSGLS